MVAEPPRLIVPAGVGAGAGVAAATANYQGCINQGAKIVVKLDAPLQLTVGT